MDTLTAEAIRLYAAGQFPGACDRFARVAEEAPSSSARRHDVGRCFEGWGWHALREGRADEAMTLFRQGLAQAPDTPGLLRAFGLAAVHAGRAGEALAPLESAARTAPDAQIRILLAHLYDHHDHPDPALEHLRAVLAIDPAHEDARRLLAKLERERQAETGFHVERSRHFVLKYRSSRPPHVRSTVRRSLEAANERVAAHLGDLPGEPVTVVLYDREQFHGVTGAHGWASGLFDGKIRLPVANPLPPRAELDRLVIHEYAHAVIHRLARGRAPRWLQEGLAQALEGTTADPMLRVPGGPTLAGIEALVGDPDPLRAKTGYDVALWVVSDLLDRGGMTVMRQLLVRLGSGETPAEAMPRLYGTRLPELEAQWRRLLGG